MYKRECNDMFTKNNNHNYEHSTVHFAHPNFRDSSNNTLLKQTLCDDNNLDQALDWLRHSAREQDHSDVWHLSYKPQYWALHKEKLKQRILDNTFEFQVVRDLESRNESGQRQVREMSCAEDRILIRALSQVLTLLVQTATPKTCTHIADRGGLKGAVKDIQQHISQHQDAFIYKSDVKSYYASIEHRILHDQLCQLFPNEPILCRLFWQFMQRTVERGGNYRDICKGIPLGSSLSPLLAAIYLIPLDLAFSQNPTFYYRRYIDDWVIICHSRRQLRKITKEVYTIMKSLHVEIHPKKTWLGKVKNGFDFLGFRISPTTIQASTESVSRRDSKVVRLYEQGASKKRIGQYLRRWLGWGIMGCVSFAPVYAATPAPASECFTGPSAPLGVMIGVPSSPLNYFYIPFILGRTAIVQTAPPETLGQCETESPNDADLTVCGPPFTISTSPFYVQTFNTTSDTYCNYQITLTPTTASATYLPPQPQTTTSVPIFTPIGLIATISGLLWFGRRRKAMKVTQS